MGLFGGSRIKVRKDSQEEESIFFLDYNKFKESSRLKSEILKNLIGGNRYFAVVDTTLSRAEEKQPDDKEAEELINFFEEHKIKYNKVVIKSDAQISLLGISLKLNSKEKVNSYIIGFILSADQLEIVQVMTDKYNAYYYAVSEGADDEKLLDEFKEIRGDREELDKRYGYYVYYDDYIKMIRISTHKENEAHIEQVINKTIEQLSK